MDEEYLTLGQAAEYTGVSRVSIWHMVKDGRLPAYSNPRDRRATLVGPGLENVRPGAK